MDAVEHPYAEEDEINLLDLLMVLVKHKTLIISMVFISGLAAVAISLLMTNIYRSEATIIARTQEEASFNPLTALGGLGGAMAEGLGLGGGGSLEKLEVVLKSRNLTNRVIKKYKLMPVIFSDDWNEKKKKWNTDDPPTLQDGWEEMQDCLTIRLDIKKNTIKMGFDHKDPETAKKVADYYLTELSEVLREEVIQDATQNMRFFRKQLEKTIDSLLKEKIYSMLAKEIEKETFARAQKYYSFLILDPPIVPDPDKKIRPKRALICILSVIVAFFLAVFLAFIMEYVHRLKTEDQERYQDLVQGMKFRRKMRGS
ncbi:MAG: hypothetical protein JRG75_08110 [Deltaproteobacteria bacterium]|nr:hypothetical protein [Deltaproteobacteria bacterium]